jgi:hypothetical protein
MTGPHFVIPHLSFNFYAFFLASAVFFGEFYLYHKLQSVHKNGRLFFALISMLFTTSSILIAVKFLPTKLVSSSLCGAGGFIASALLFDKFYNHPKVYKFLDLPQPTKLPKLYFTKNCLIVAPLIYAIAKLGCAYAGCCHGFDYSGPFSFRYHTPEAHGEFFPVQPIEAIVFTIIFFIARKNKNPYIIILICAFAKFALDFLRYGHDKAFISPNQIACIFIAVATIVTYLLQKKRILSHKQPK